MNLKKLHLSIAVLGLLLSSVALQAGPVTFFATGQPGVSGSVTYNVVFDGSSSQAVSDTQITALSLNVFGSLFSFGDTVTSATTYFDSTGTPPIITDGGGFLADNGTEEIAYFPDGFSGSGLDGDASLAVAASGVSIGDFGSMAFYKVRWSTTSVPEPGSLSLLMVGLAGCAIVAARRRQTN